MHNIIDVKQVDVLSFLKPYVTLVNPLYVTLNNTMREYCETC